MVEGARLESVWRPKGFPRVRISPSPPFYRREMKTFLFTEDRGWKIVSCPKIGLQKNNINVNLN